MILREPSANTLLYISYWCEYKWNIHLAIYDLWNTPFEHCRRRNDANSLLYGDLKGQPFQVSSVCCSKTHIHLRQRFLRYTEQKPTITFFLKGNTVIRQTLSTFFWNTHFWKRDKLDLTRYVHKHHLFTMIILGLWDMGSRTLSCDR